MINVAEGYSLQRCTFKSGYLERSECERENAMRRKRERDATSSRYEQHLRGGPLRSRRASLPTMALALHSGGVGLVRAGEEGADCIVAPSRMKIQVRLHLVWNEVDRSNTVKIPSDYHATSLSSLRLSLY